MIDNFDILSSWFENLTDQEDFFFVQVIQRKKDCNISTNYNVIKNYCFFNKETFLKRKEEIITLCKAFNARAYFWVNPRNCKEIQYELIREALEAIELGTNKLYTCISKAIGHKRSSHYKAVWILDFDTKDTELITKYLDIAMGCKHSGSGLVFDLIPTVNGYHALTKGFDLKQFSQQIAITKLDNIDIHKDNPTVLYYSNK